VTHDEIAQWKALAQAATPGPWEAQSDGTIVRPGYTRKGDGTPKRKRDRDICVVSIEPNGACGDPMCCDQGEHLEVLPNNAAYIAHSSPDRVLALLEEVERLRLATTWRPIETAPKDGTRIIASNEAGDVDAVHWVDDVWWTGWVIYQHRGDVEELIPAPVRWKPMPSAR
jgi:hypothetical protein